MAEGLARRIDTLSASEQTRLARILAMLSSPYEGERAAAASLASAFIARHGLMWGDLIDLLRPIPETAEAVFSHPDRRRQSGNAWRGYERRRAAPLGMALDRIS